LDIPMSQPRAAEAFSSAVSPMPRCVKAVR